MNEYDSPNYTEYTYERRAEGKQKLLKGLFVLGYVLFVAAFFLFCYISRVIPLFAVCPIFTWMLVYFTWEYVSFDVYYTFNHGDMELGRLKKKKGGFLRRPVLKFNVRSALLIAPYDEAIASLEYNNVKKKVDLSSSSQSTKRAVAIYPSDKGVVAVTFELTPKSATLISSFCENSKKLKEITK